MSRKKVFMGLFGLAASEKFAYDDYFQIMPAGPAPKTVSRAIQATRPDVVFIASDPPDSAGVVRAINEGASRPSCSAAGWWGCSTRRS